MSDPYRPPSSEGDEALAQPGSWTVGGVLGSVASSVARQPLAAFVAIFVLPMLWSLPAELLQRRLIPSDAPTFGPERHWLSVATSWGVAAWDGLCFPGQLLAALSVVEGRAIRFGDFVWGLRKAPIVFLSGMLLGLPFELASLLPIDAESTAGLLLFMVTAAIVSGLSIKLLFWQPLLLRTTHGFWHTLTLSWLATRGLFVRILTVGVVVVLLTLPCFFLEAALLSSDRFFVGFELMGALLTLALAQLYLLCAQPPSSRMTGTPEP